MRNTLSSAVASTEASAWPVSAMRRTCFSACTSPARARTRSCIIPWSSRSCRYVVARLKRRVGGGDHRAAQAMVAIVKHQRLPRRHCALRTGKADVQAAVVAYPYFTGLCLLPVAGLRAACERSGRGGAIDPVRGLGPGVVRQQVAAVAALVDEQHVGRDVLADHVPGRRREPAQPADLESFALAEGEVEDARMGADHAPVGRLHFARARGQVA